MTDVEAIRAGRLLLATSHALNSHRWAQWPIERIVARIIEETERKETTPDAPARDEATS